VPEQRLLSPEICRWWRRSCRTSSRKTPINLGFGLWEALNRRRGVVRSGPGPPHHMAARARGAPPYGEPALWPPSGSRSVFILRPRKIEVLVFVSSNSENISCVAFLKHKTSESRELTLWHLVNRLVLENA
jgi:hypothetical protein